MSPTEARYGSYDLSQSNLFRQIGEERGVLAPQTIMPELRFGRPVNRRDDFDLQLDWHNYLDELAAENTGRGHAEVFGGMVVNYVETSEMSIMLAKKNPGLFEGIEAKRRLFQTLKSLKQEFRDSVIEQSAKLVDRQNKLVLLPKDETDEEESSEGEVDRIARQWNAGVFSLERHPSKFGKNVLAFAFAGVDSEMIEEEMVNTWDFLKHQGFDTKVINQQRKPHLSVYRTFHPLGAVYLREPDEIPAEITLLQPKALYNDNKPYPTGPR